MKKKIIILIVFITFILFSPTTINDLNSNNIENVEEKQDDNENYNSNTIKNYLKNLKTSEFWDGLPSIHITGANWSDAAAIYPWINGSGILNDPYVIENITIDAEGTGSGILIENSSVYFTIKNCTVYNSGSSGSGIILVNVSNGNLINNAVNYNFYGIRLERNSENNTISGNNACYNLYGISLSNCDNNTISGNNACYNPNEGIELEWYSNNNTISGNNASYNTYGIDLSIYCDNNTISGNYASHNSLYGLYLLLGCDSNTISGNNASSNSGDGIYLAGCTDNMISGNTVNNNNKDGIFLIGNSNNNIVSRNTVNNNIHGILMYDSYNNIVSENILVGNVYSIEEVYCKYDTNNIIEDDNIYYTVILPSGIGGFEINPYRVEDVKVNITVALVDDTEVFFSGFYNNTVDVSLDNGLIFMNLHFNDTDNLDQNLDAPINITLKYDTNKYAGVEAFWFNEDGAWEKIPLIDLGNGVVVISVNHASMFALVGKIPLPFPLLIVIITFLIGLVSSIAVSSTYYNKKRSNTRVKPLKKETIRIEPQVKSYGEKSVKSRNLKDHVEKDTLLKALKEKNALEKPALFHDLKINAVSHGFWEKLDKLELNEEDFNDFLNEMFSLAPEERMRIIEGMLKLGESNSENATQLDYN